MTEKSKMTKFWTRNRAGNWQLVAGRDESGVPEVCWRTYNRKFWLRKERNELYPADAMDAYQAGVQAMLAAQARIDRGEVELQCKPTTYVIACGLTRLREFVRLDVLPPRKRFREMFDKCRVNGEFDVRQFVEQLPHLHEVTPEETRFVSRLCIDDTLPKCSPDTQTAISALLEHQMNISAAAKAIGMKRSTFARKCRQKWFRDFRRAAK